MEKEKEYYAYRIGSFNASTAIKGINIFFSGHSQAGGGPAC